MHGLLLVPLAVLAACATQRPDAKPEQAPPAPRIVESLPASPIGPIDAALDIEQTPATPALKETAIKTGINERFLDPNLNVERWKKTFEGESREVYAARQEVIAALNIKPGQSVADIGAGTGFYLWEFAKKAGPTGHVFGVEIAPRFLERLRAHVTDKKIANASIITGTDRSVELPEDSVDLVFICDTYHHFEYPQTTLASIRSALRPGGALVIIDFHRIKGKSADWVLRHVRAGQQEFRSEIEAAGFAYDKELAIAGFSENYMIRFLAKE